METLLTSGCISNFHYLFLKTWYPTQGPRLYLDRFVYTASILSKRSTLPVLGYLTSQHKTIEAISAIKLNINLHLPKLVSTKLCTCNQEQDMYKLIASPFLILSALVCSYVHREPHAEILTSLCSYSEIAGPKVPCLV